MVRLVEEEWGIQIAKVDLINLEEKIIKTLDYELHYVCPIVFLERFQRIFGLDEEYHFAESKIVGELARRLLRIFVSHSSFLRFKTSHMAGAALMLSINIAQSKIATQIDLPFRLKNLNQKSTYFQFENAQNSVV